MKNCCSAVDVPYFLSRYNTDPLWYYPTDAPDATWPIGWPASPTSASTVTRPNLGYESAFRICR